MNIQTRGLFLSKPFWAIEQLYDIEKYGPGFWKVRSGYGRKYSLKTMSGPWFPEARVVAYFFTNRPDMNHWNRPDRPVRVYLI